MPRRNPIKRRNKHKHLFVNDLEDPVLEPRTSKTRVPIDWEVSADGEDTPVFAIEYAYTEKDLEPYKAYPRLYRERWRVEKHSGTPFPFLRLPPELRVEIYRHWLVCVYAIDLVGSTFEKDRRDKIATRVLRTYRRINAEGSQVLYGGNEFRIWRSDNFLIAPYILKQDFGWLKELTMRIPFMGKDQVVLHAPTIESIETVAPSNSIFTPSNHYSEGNRLLRSLLDCIAKAPYLRRLHLVIPPFWDLLHRGESDYTSLDYEWAVVETPARLCNSHTWNDLQTLLNHKPTLEVTVTRLRYQYEEEWYQIAHTAYLRKLRHKLGIWDQREAIMNEWTDEWTMPPRTEVNLAVSIRDSQLLFGDI